MIFLTIYSFFILFDFYLLATEDHQKHHFKLATRPNPMIVTITEAVVIFWGLMIEIDEIRQVKLLNNIFFSLRLYFCN
jgi:hypothetical protein